MLTRFTIIALAISLFFAVGCDKNSERDDDRATEQAAEEVDEGSDEADEQTEDEADEASEDDEGSEEMGDDEEGEASGEKAAASVNAFSHALFDYVDDGNAVFSPTSISTAMAMVYAGAGGETAEQIASAMVYPDAAVEALGALSKTLDERDIEGDEKSLVLDIANDLWVDDDLDIGESYLETVDAEFGAEPTGLDFAGAPDEAREEINAHVAEKTRD
ncbi:MAG: serpin family protein, partial [Persicimonas sp.]